MILDNYNGCTVGNRLKPMRGGGKLKVLNSPIRVPGLDLDIQILSYGLLRHFFEFITQKCSLQSLRHEYRTIHSGWECKPFIGYKFRHH